MIEFYQTVMGKRYYDYQLPELTKQLTRIADLMEKGKKLSVEDIKEKVSFKEAYDKYVPKESKKEHFRSPNETELKLLLERQKKLLYGNAEGVDDSEAQDVISSSKIIVIDYIPDCPGKTGSLIFISYGVAMEYYEVLEIVNSELKVLTQADELKEKLVFIDDDIVTKPIPTIDSLKMIRLNPEEAKKILDDDVFLNGSSTQGEVIAVYGVEFGEHWGRLHITEYENGKFWTIGERVDILGTLTECINFLKEEFK